MATCNWCAEDLSGAPRKVWYDDDGHKYCSEYCLKMATQEEDEIDPVLTLKNGGKNEG